MDSGQRRWVWIIACLRVCPVWQSVPWLGECPHRNCLESGSQALGFEIIFTVSNKLVVSLFLVLGSFVVHKTGHCSTFVALSVWFIQPCAHNTRRWSVPQPGNFTGVESCLQQTSLLHQKYALLWATVCNSVSISCAIACLKTVPNVGFLTFFSFVMSQQRCIPGKQVLDKFFAE